MKAEFHPREAERLAALASYGLLDSPPEAEFDDLVKVLSQFCDAPVSLISLVDHDRQWFKAKVGVDIDETPILQSICAHGILQRDVFEIPDTAADPRTADNPLVADDPNIRFYAGAPLETADGLPLGMLCVLDVKPRTLNEAQRNLLRVMANQVMNQLQLRRSLKRAETLIEHNEILRKEADHRVKNSLHQVVAFLALQERQSPEAATVLAEARRRVATVASVHDHLHRSTTGERIQVVDFLKSLLENISENRPANVERIDIECDRFDMLSDRIMALGLATNELVQNAMKHGFPEGRQGRISVTFRSTGEECCLTVHDNGIGFPQDFDASSPKGLGMRVVQALAAQLKGRLAWKSDVSGSEVSLHYPCNVSA